MHKDTLKKWIKAPWKIAISLDRRGYLDFLPDKQYLSIIYRANFKKKINWKAPKTFNEKLQWLKLYDRKPIYCKMADKFDAKQFAENIIGSEYIIPILGGPWDSFDEIDFDSLPQQFVLKTTHDCGGVLICMDKSNFDYAYAKQFIQKHLKRNYYLRGREWPYKNIKPRIFAEKYLSGLEDSDLQDYKFLCFEGIPKVMLIASERQSKEHETRFDFYNMNFIHLPFTNEHPNAVNPPEIPKSFERMKELAAMLSKDIPHLRVDFYESNGQLYLGEMTFFHWSGFVPFKPNKWDHILGSWIVLPERP